MIGKSCMRWGMYALAVAPLTSTEAQASGITTSYQGTGNVTVFQNDQAGWLAAAGSTVLLDFDSIPGSTTTPIQGGEFSALPGAPFLSAAPLSETPDVYVGDPTSQLDAPSLPNMMGPTCDSSCEGIVTVTFAQPVTAAGALFLDVEADYATTGYSLTPNSPFPEFAFNSSQGQASVAFLGIVSDQPFTSVDIHFSTGPNIDGVLIDDLQYALASGVPVPLLSPLGLGTLAVAVGFAALVLIYAKRKAAVVHAGQRH